MPKDKRHVAGDKPDVVSDIATTECDAPTMEVEEAEGGQDRLDFGHDSGGIWQIQTVSDVPRGV